MSDDFLKPRKAIGPGTVIYETNRSLVILGWICECSNNTREIMICAYHNQDSGIVRIVAPTYSVRETLALAELLTHRNQQVRDWFARLEKQAIKEEELGTWYILQNEICEFEKIRKKKSKPADEAYEEVYEDQNDEDLDSTKGVWTQKYKKAGASKMSQEMARKMREMIEKNEWA